MPSNFTKETSNINKSKSKKVMEYVHLLSTHQEDKVKKIDKKIYLNKNQTEFKTNLNKELCSNKYHLDKEKFSLNLNHEIKKHARSKTQYFKPLNQVICPDDIYQEEPIASRYDLKKKAIKRQQSQKRIKSESSKRLQANSQSKSNLHQSKSKLKPQTAKYISAPIKQSKILHKTTLKHDQPENKQILSINENLTILKQKLRKQKSTFSSKDKKVNKKLQDSKNMTFLNLSRILQTNDCDQDFFCAQNNRRDHKSDRSIKRKNTTSNKQKLREIFSNLERRVQYITGSILEATTQKNGQKNHRGNDQKIDERSFSFMENPVINAKLRKSNFSTGQGSIGPDYEVQQLLKLKHATQSQINKQISMDLKLIKEIYQANQEESRPKTARVIESQMKLKEKNSARTCEKHEEDKNSHKQSNWSDRQSLLNLLTKYHETSVQILPFLSEFNIKDSKQQKNPQIVQAKKMKRESQDLREENRKFINKYNEIVQRNFKYQHLINALIQDGVDVQKYMQEFFNRKG